MEITVPRLGWSMEEAIFAAWLKPAGATVKAGEALFTLESDKATQDVEALDTGVLRLPTDAPKPGTTVKVGQCIGYLDSVDGSPSPAKASLDLAQPIVAPEAISPIPASGVVARNRIAESRAAHAHAQAPDSDPQIRISPRALRVAAQLGVEWASLRGSGRTGRIREVDVRAAVTRGRKPGSLGNLSVTRRLIAERMSANLRQTAPVTLHTTADATAWVTLRTRLKSDRANSGPVPSYTDMLIHQVAAVLAEHPHVNARWEDDSLFPKVGIHIGLAVDTEAGLVVPVIQDANTLTLDQLAARTRELVERARTRRLSPDEMQGGTFTVTSLGAFGVDAFTPIINYPECAILGLGRIRREPTVVGDQIVPRDRVTLSLSFDHRAFDGAPAARFLQAVCQRLEQGSDFSTGSGVGIPG